MDCEHVFAGVPVADLGAAVEWYERLIGRPPDLVPNATEAAWRLTDTGWICLIDDPAHAGSALHTILIDDLEELASRAAGSGIAVGEIESVAENVRQIVLRDPDRNRLKVGQVSGGR